MDTQFHTCGLNISAKVRHWFTEQLDQFQSLIPITAAAFVLEHPWDTAPAFRGLGSPAVSGPDTHAEARDHALKAAWSRVPLLCVSKPRQKPISTPGSRGGAPR
jgi:hypothetical protein